MSKSKSIILIVPYFGKLPNYFQLWLESCSHNKSIDWLLFIDDKTNYQYPKNVKVNYCDFGFMQNQFKSYLGSDIVLNEPYQLCEFRISYGLVFDDFIKSFDYWGYCDVDVIWGDLRAFITDKVLDNYDKIGWRGHLTLFRKDIAINKVFTIKVEDKNWSDIAFNNTTQYPLALDEGGICYLFEKMCKLTFTNFPFADLKIRSFNFELMHVNDAVENSTRFPSVFLWNGKLLRYSIVNKKVCCHEFAYIHFLKRPMKYTFDITKDVDSLKKSFWIVPNCFLKYDELTLDEINITHYGRKRVYIDYLLSRLNCKYIFNKIKVKNNKRNFIKKHGWFNFRTPYYSFDLKNYNDLND